jgi:hypothetical protein
MFSLRHDDHMELHQALVTAGEKPDENGSFMSVVHETVVGVRACLTGISKKTLPAFASGEENMSKNMMPRSRNRLVIPLCRKS